ncbi:MULTISPECIES: bifunctional diguanylate cyclase/phosphodiesterase [Actinoplanes]|uniref:putative bifunctional diguanylate cyclase/phosphodiesterase n=1 Tax=Actinoplanes TaxID=1865 RepID=UPI000696A504|nr:MULTISPECIES: bifunctional diguanylate cyclase/phosphodiesterase [Actinoplanes]GLY02571.1 hypothetical protein Acsp01_29500 [Actinoplanes sp. NBRC 101535]
MPISLRGGDPERAGAQPDRRDRLWHAVLLTAGLVAIGVPLLAPEMRMVAYLPVVAVALGAVVTGTRRPRIGPRWPWWVMGAAMVCSAVAGGFPDYTDGVDVLHVVMCLLFTMGLLGLPGGREWSGLTEAGIVLCTGAALEWVFLYDPLVHDRTATPAAENTIVYPMLDLLVLGAVVRLIVVRGGLNRAEMELATAATVLTAADVIFFVSAVTGESGGPAWSTVGWLFGFLLVGTAALRPEDTEQPGADQGRPHGWRTVLANIVLVLIGPVVTVYLLITENDGEDFDKMDVLLPMGSTGLTAVLLVIRLSHTTALAYQQTARLRQAVREQAGLQETLSHQASHDALTGLPNRQTMKGLIADVATGRTGGAFLLLGLDGFKDVNERLGHPIGDALLIEVAARLSAATRDGETAARLGGDEFALLLPGSTAENAALRAEALLGELRRPVLAGSQSLRPSASIGVRGFAPASDSVHILSDADLALYAAKSAGKDQVAVFDPAMREEQAERIRLLDRLGAALDADEFAVHYQPIVALEGGTVVGVEALVRWFPPGQKPVGPDRFIPAAEDSGLIIALGEWVLRQACRDAVAWHRRWGTGVSVNVSPRQLADPAFTVKALGALRDSGLPATALTVEITEGVLVRSGAHAQQAIAHLQALRAEGVRVAIDDFGTGYSSLAYLRDLPIDVLKVDRAFMPEDGADTSQLALVRTIVDLARSMGLVTVAEGVETPVQADLLRVLGCTRGQGYYFARPVSGPDLEAMLTAAELAHAG